MQWLKEYWFIVIFLVSCTWGVISAYGSVINRLTIVEKSVSSELVRKDDLDEIKDLMARMDTKVELLLENKIREEK